MLIIRMDGKRPDLAAARPTRGYHHANRAGRSGINKIERDMVERLAQSPHEPEASAGITGGLTPAGVDRLAMCPDWGEVPQPVMPADVVAAANAGEPWRKPAPGEIPRLHTAWSKQLAAARMSDGQS